MPVSAHGHGPLHRTPRLGFSGTGWIALALDAIDGRPAAAALLSAR